MIRIRTWSAQAGSYVLAMLITANLAPRCYSPYQCYRQQVGGITQHIGAYQVEIQGKQAVFLDTPGREAFTAMVPGARSYRYCHPGGGG